MESRVHVHGLPKKCMSTAFSGRECPEGNMPKHCPRNRRQSLCSECCAFSLLCPPFLATRYCTDDPRTGPLKTDNTDRGTRDLVPPAARRDSNHSTLRTCRTTRDSEQHPYLYKSVPAIHSRTDPPPTHPSELSLSRASVRHVLPIPHRLCETEQTAPSGLASPSYNT